MCHFNAKIRNAHAPCHVTGWYGAKVTIKESLLGLGASPLYSSFRPKIVPTKGGPTLRFFVNYGIQMLFLCIITPKRHILTRNHVVWRILRENRFRGFGCGPLEGPGKKKPSKHLWCAISRIRGNETPSGIVSKFCVWVRHSHVRNFWRWSVKWFGRGNGSNSPFPHGL